LSTFNSGPTVGGPFESTIILIFPFHELRWTPSSIGVHFNLDWLSIIWNLEEVWSWDGIHKFSKSFFGTNEGVVIISELDVIEVTIDGIETSSSSEVED
jgi:hypothetical protein